MPSSRWQALLRLFLIGVLAAAPLACMEVVTSKAQLVVAGANAICPVGSQGCACTGGGGCDPGLYCDAGICVWAGGEAGEAEEYMFEDDFAPMPIAEPTPSDASMRMAPSPRKPSRRAERQLEKRFGKHSSDTSSAPAPEASVAPMPSPVEAMEPALSDTPRDPADELNNARQVIYTATLQVSVFDLDAAAELAESLPQRYGGWIESRYNYQITLRITAARLFDAIAELSALGVVLDKTLLAEDVTAEYVDLESRIRVLELIVAQLEALLARATSVEQALLIRVELDRLRIELEAARVRMRVLAELVDFSTLTLILSPRSPIDLLPSSNDPFPWVDTLGVESTAYR